MLLYFSTEQRAREIASALRRADLDVRLHRPYIVRRRELTDAQWMVEVEVST